MMNPAKNHLLTRSRWLIRSGLAVFLLMLVVAAGCTSDSGSGKAAGDAGKEAATLKTTPVQTAAAEIDEQPSTVYYEIFVRSFYDTNGDGIGDLNGVTAKLEYLKDLGIGGIWLMPINPSPSYHGYDVTDYYGIQSQYGTMDDFKKLLYEAHKRGIKVIMDLVVNHTSSEHPWFKAAASDKNSPYRDWYTWSKPDQTLASDGATGAQPWHKSGDDHYLGIFWEGMPDLNFDHPDVRKEMIKVGQFWMKQGLDGFRLDAAKHIYEDFKSQGNLSATKEKNQAWWQEFRKGIEEVHPGAYLVGEVWDSTAKIGPFLAQALDSCFNFDLSKTILSTVNSEKATDIAFNLERIYGFYAKNSNGNFVDAPFLTNHDMNRTMSEVKGNPDHAKMAASILLTLPGNPFLYYGEEIGMLGMKPDEQIREPMVWSAAAVEGAEGQTTWEPFVYNKNMKQGVAEQGKDTESLYNHYKKLIQWRNAEPALHDGGIASYKFENTSVLAYQRLTTQAKVLVVHNLSKEVQKVVLQDDAYKTLALKSKEGAVLNGTSLELPPYSTVILK
ncbi:alpha-amylase family glycosyl hydrolase [Paenibacillus terrigena]|uniref:alpha-amylase family glycosyl hydrolase n=1 Tax=Paenibacillus terrigena TaxID=369333 RepID=UPI0028D80390|nr:alpha-amylase family glycosyl hydrolase [Paenibacillus terrigena]